MMDWCFGYDTGELAVPKDLDYFDRLPSPDGWLQWGVSGLSNSQWQNDFDACESEYLPNGKPHQRVFFGKGRKEINQPEGESSYGSCNLGGSSDDSLTLKSAGCGCRDHHFDNLMRTDPTDDIFLSSLLEDDLPEAVDNHSPPGPTPLSQGDVMQADSYLMNRMLEFQSIPCDTDGVGSSKCLETLPLSSSHGSDNGNGSDQSSDLVKAKDMLPCDQEGSRRSPGEVCSVEESVLQGLEAVVIQLSDETRLCFRDSLYRLAHRSKKQKTTEEAGNQCLNPGVLETDGGQTRSAGTETAESDTNAIDRAVANLMFNDVDTNIVDLPAMSAELDDMDMKFCIHGSSQEDTFLSLKPSKLLADSEVPVFSRQDPHPMQNASEQLITMWC